METITHREMRNRSADVLRRVEAGESLQVSNNGRPVAVIVPVGGAALDGLVARGEARRARRELDALAGIRRTSSERSTTQLIADARGRW